MPVVQGRYYQVDVPAQMVLELAMVVVMEVGEIHLALTEPLRA